MKLYIAEKPSLGRAIAEVLPRPLQRGEGYITAANGDCISWCVGHLLEQAEPHIYDPQYKSWKMQHLPIVPQTWKLQPKRDTKSQLAVLRKLVAKADQLVHAGDPDREGQLLVDQVIAYFKVSTKRRADIQRLLINDLNPAAVQRALSRLEKNSEFAPLSASALARSRADWLYGINMTRAYTIQGRKAGYDGVLSVGRVQTPVLGLVVRRCEDIEAFVSKPYFEVLAHLLTDKCEAFTARWQPSEACQPYMDESGHVLLKKLAENVVSRITDKPATVQKCEKKKKKQSPPLPYSLSILQIDAARRYGLNAQVVLSCCQSLYEKHKLITYPRSDCRFLPEEHYTQAPVILEAIAANHSELQKAVSSANRKLRSAAWNDKKVTAHHAIIPTNRRLDTTRLSVQERQIYGLVARQYVAQFYPPHEYADTRAELIIEGGLFVASAKTVLLEGWRALFKVPDKKVAKKPDAKSGNTELAEAEAAAEPSTLPPLAVGQIIRCQRGELVEKNTTPPPYFTDATLLAAMTGIARFVKSADTKKILKDTDGLGTEATRAGIIELLFRRGFLVRQGKQIHATDAGRGLIHSLPDVATQPDMTAHWESTLNAISQKEASYHDFMLPLQSQLQVLVAESANGAVNAMQGITAVVAGGASKNKGANRKYRSAKKFTGKKKARVKKKAASGKNSKTKKRPPE